MHGQPFQVRRVDEHVDVAAMGELVESRSEDDRTSATAGQIADDLKDGFALSLGQPQDAGTSGIPRVSLNGVLRLGRLNPRCIVNPSRSAPIDSDPGPTPPSCPLARPVAPGTAGS